MGNTNGSIYLNSSRQTVDNPKDNYNAERPFHVDVVNFLDTTGNFNVAINRYLPVGFSGFPVHETFNLDRINPYQTVSLAHPDTDPWYLTSVSSYLATTGYTRTCEQSYIYVITQTGYSVLTKNEKPVFPNEFSEGMFLSEADFEYPKLVVRELEPELYSYTLSKSSSMQVTRLVDFRDADLRVFKFYIERAKQLCGSKKNVIPHFMAQFHAYVFTVLFFQWMNNSPNERYNPFPNASVTARLSYPYILLADVIMLDNYYTVDSRYAMILVAAMHFTRKWARMIWHIDTLNRFHYGYLDAYYTQAALTVQSKIEAHFQLLLRQVEQTAISRYLASSSGLLSM